MLTAFKKLKSSGSGTTTDEEQDLLRAMLVLASSGLDAFLKKLIQEALPILAEKDQGARDSLTAFAQRRIKSLEEGTGAGGGAKFLAGILAARNPQDKLIEKHVANLTGDSSQSLEQLFRIIKALGLETDQVDLDKDSFKEIFSARNKIIHELDMNFDHPNRNRQSRTRDSMVRHVNIILAFSAKILDLVDKKVGELKGAVAASARDKDAIRRG